MGTERKKRRGEEEGGDEEEREKRKGGEEEFSLSRRVWEREGKKHDRLRRARLKSPGAARMVSHDGYRTGGGRSGTPAVLVLVPGLVTFGLVSSRLVLFLSRPRVLPNVPTLLRCSAAYDRLATDSEFWTQRSGYDGGSRAGRRVP